MIVSKSKAVPPEDSVCRFIRPRDWSTAEKRPRPSAFSQTDLSVWNERRLIEDGVEIEELQIDMFEGYGQAYHTVADYFHFASEVEAKTGESCKIRIEWRTCDEYVPEPWRLWREAHVQVEMVNGLKLPPTLRRLLAMNTRRSVEPKSL